LHFFTLFVCFALFVLCLLQAATWLLTQSIVGQVALRAMFADFAKRLGLQESILKATVDTAMERFLKEVLPRFKPTFKVRVAAAVSLAVPLQEQIPESASACTHRIGLSPLSPILILRSSWAHPLGELTDVSMLMSTAGILYSCVLTTIVHEVQHGLMSVMVRLLRNPGAVLNFDAVDQAVVQLATETKPPPPSPPRATLIMTVQQQPTCQPASQGSAAGQVVFTIDPTAESGYELWEKLLGFSVRPRELEKDGTIVLASGAYALIMLPFLMTRSDVDDEAVKQLDCVRAEPPFVVALKEKDSRYNFVRQHEREWSDALTQAMGHFTEGQSRQTSNQLAEPRA
jgi:hypothetical protein